MFSPLVLGLMCTLNTMGKPRRISKLHTAIPICSLQASGSHVFKGAELRWVFRINCPAQEVVDGADKYRYVARLGMYLVFQTISSPRQVGVINARWSSTEKIVLPIRSCGSPNLALRRLRLLLQTTCNVTAIVHCPPD